ncbi:MAG: hypothetical protein JXN59_09680 [Anaerolineae bacterium]|nr:hypothetical protein [Anaerolineae bacterium]
MRIHKLPAVVLAIIFLLGSFPPGARAQTGTPRIQELNGRVNDDMEVVLYDLHVEAGHTLYLYLETTYGSLDTYLGLGTSGFAQPLREDDDSGGDYNSALEYPIRESGTYRIAATRYDSSTWGGFRLLVGIDAPEVMQGRGQAAGQPFVTAAGTAAREDVPLNGMGINFTDCSVLEPRPTLSGRVQTIDTRFFRLHYTMTGGDAVTQDYADEVASVLDSIWKQEINEFGWPAPPQDCGEGGDSRYDVYLMDTLNEGDMLGYTDPQAILGDNPSSEGVEGWATYSYLVIENDFDGDAERNALMRATAAHEFHHAIQFGYDVNDMGGHWYYEASATWMETQVYPEEEDASPYVPDLFSTPDLCVGAIPEDDYYSMRIYGEWLLIDSLAQDHGKHVIRRLWELIADYEGMESFYQLAAELHTSPQRIIQRYAIRNLLRDYALAENFGARVRVEALVAGEGDVVPRQSGVQQLGVDYVLVTQPGIYTFEIDQPNLTMTAVGVHTKTSEAHIYELGKRGTLNTAPYEYMYILLLNVDLHENSDFCITTDWVLSVTDGRQTLPTVGEPKRWPAPYFQPAR